MLGASIRGGCGCKAWGITVSPNCLAFAECRILLGGGGGGGAFQHSPYKTELWW